MWCPCLSVCLSACRSNNGAKLHGKTSSPSVKVTKHCSIVDVGLCTLVTAGFLWLHLVYTSMMPSRLCGKYCKNSILIRIILPLSERGWVLYAWTNKCVGFPVSQMRPQFTMEHSWCHYPAESLPWSSYNYRKDHLMFWVHLQWDHDSGHVKWRWRCRPVKQFASVNNFVLGCIEQMRIIQLN